MLFSSQAEKLVDLCLEKKFSVVPGWRYEGLTKLNRDLPSVLIIAMKRSGSTYLLRAFNKAGWLDIPYVHVEQAPDVVNRNAGWMAANGFVMRIHSLPSDQVIGAIKAFRPKHVIFLYRDPMDAAFSLFVRKFYNPAGLDKHTAIPEHQSVDQETFTAFIEEATKANASFLQRWKTRLPELSRPIIAMRYEDFYRDKEKNFGRLSDHLGIRIDPPPRDDSTNWQGPLTARLKDRYAEWLA